MFRKIIFLSLLSITYSFQKELPLKTYKCKSTRQLKEFRSTSNTNEKVPWDFLRFLQQSSKFMPFPKPPSLFNPRKEIASIKPGDVLWKAGSLNEFTFSPLDDVVMGGASSSSFDDATGLWKGNVSTANNGGFVGIRSTPFSKELDMSECKGIEISLRSSKGKKIKGMLRDTNEFNGPVWSASFDIKNNGIFKTRLPFDKLIATKYASTLNGKEFQKENVYAIQLVYSKFEYNEDLNPSFTVGDFSLQIVEISAY